MSTTDADIEANGSTAPQETADVVETSAGSERIPINVRIRLRLRTRHGIEFESYVRTEQLDPLELDPMQLVCEDKYDGGSWGTVRRITLTFSLEGYDPESRTATYQPYEMTRSDRRREMLVTGWNFSRERSPRVQEGDAADV